jgi:serine/threonine-protein kinase SRPK3
MSQNRYFAAKILTVCRTQDHHSGRNLELEALRQLDEVEFLGPLPILFDHFEEVGPEGTHLCLIVNVLNTDISDFRQSAPNNVLAVYIVQNINAQILEGLVQLHELGIIHSSLFTLWL